MLEFWSSLPGHDEVGFGGHELHQRSPPGVALNRQAAHLPTQPRLFRLFNVRRTSKGPDEVAPQVPNVLGSSVGAMVRGCPRAIHTRKVASIRGLLLIER